MGSKLQSDIPSIGDEKCPQVTIARHAALRVRSYEMYASTRYPKLIAIKFERVCCQSYSAFDMGL